ncbi:MAG: peptidylprolyl isomerase [Oscillospiraceae bacterium]|nr:peptidylprolyl isomerase [Oscillospiraceae bacterium]
MIKKIKAAALVLAAAVSAGVLLTGCKGESTADEALALVQGDIRNFEMPEPGEKIAVITVKDYGEIKIKLFADAAPEAVENFTGLADMGYYDELIFHRIIPNFMIQGGDPKGNGTGGKSIWGDKFDGGIPEGLYHFSGAVAYANSGSTSTNGSQFYIVNTPEAYLQYSCEDLMASDPSSYSWPQNVIDMYNEKGGVPFLDGGYTVFGQVFEGLDIVRELGNVETDSNDKPLKQVQMESVRIVEYEG